MSFARPAAERPGDDVTHTNNWPPEPLLGHAPTTGAVVWSVPSVILLIAGIGMMVWYHAMSRGAEAHPTVPSSDPLLALKPTP